MILIHGARVVCPVTGTDKTEDILIDGDRIAGVGTECAGILSQGEDLTVIDGKGLVAAPGLVDPHVHFRDPGFTWKEDILTGAAAAAKGGFTTVICMANTDPCVDDPETLRYVLDKGAGTGIRVLSASTLTKGLGGRELVDMEAMAGAGAAVFTDDGKCVTDEKLLLQGFQRAASLNIPVSLHEEDPALIGSPGVNAGRIAAKAHVAGADAVSEEVMAARDCVLAMKAGARMCIQHVSSAGTVRIIRAAREAGADVHGEATPHHFFFTEEEVLHSGTNARMNPPLRTEKDREEIIRGLRDGTLDMIATDHAPHSAEEKALPMEKAPSGVIGLETALGAGIEALVKPKHLSLMQLIERMSTAPARFAGLEPGSIRKGSRADLVLFDENEYRMVTEDGFVSKSANSPFIGKELPGQVKCTICGGKVVYRSSAFDIAGKTV